MTLDTENVTISAGGINSTAYYFQKETRHTVMINTDGVQQTVSATFKKKMYPGI